MPMCNSSWLRMRATALLALLFALLMIRAPVAMADAAAAEESAEAPAVLSRVGVIGASATCGFGVGIEIAGPHGPTTTAIDFGQVVQAMLPEHAIVNHHGSLFFFNAPMAVGPELVSQALLHEPTVIIGIDYLFWYGYGHRDAAGQPITDDSARLKLLEQGFKQLERFECPVVVGDFPNMAAAVGKMLGAAQLPEPATLDALNKRVRQWAADRPNVTVFSLSELVGAMQNGEEVRIGEQVWTVANVAQVIQDDQLHPTVDGLVLMAQKAVMTFIESQPQLDAAQFELERDAIMARLRQNIELQARELHQKMQDRQSEQSQSQSHSHPH